MHNKVIFNGFIIFVVMHASFFIFYDHLYLSFSHVGLYVLHFHPPHSQPLSCKGEGGKNAPLIVRWLCGAGEYDWLRNGTDLNHPLI